MTQNESSFEELLTNIEDICKQAGSIAKSAVNQLLTMRNWLIGSYIVEYEQNGNDRAAYGTSLLKEIETRLNIKGLNVTVLELSRKLYLCYPQISATVSQKFRINVPQWGNRVIEGSSTDERKPISVNSATVSQKCVSDPARLVSTLSFSHLREIMTVDDPFERFFYETECMKCAWSVRELRRQISTNLYFRAGISKNPELLLSQLPGTESSNLDVRDPFVFEFLGLDAKNAVSESDLEQAIMDHLQKFILEMGKGFCFEARQKRIIIDDRYYFADLVFYNRLLHCNVIIELKNDEFRHEYLGQLNAYVGYYKENEMHEGDNLPVGILLCTRKGPKMVEYALSGMDNQLFVSTYMLHLPEKKQLEDFLLEDMKEMGL